MACSETRPFSPLPVHVADCAEVLGAGVCEFEADTAVTLWVPGVMPIELEVEVSSESFVVTRTGTPRGTRLVIPTPRPGVIRLRGPARSSFVLSLAPFRPLPRLAEAEALKREGRFEEARALVEEVLERSLPARDRAASAALLGRILHRLGELEAAREHLEAAIIEADAGGLLRTRAQSALVLAYLLGYRLADPGGALEILQFADRDIPLGIDCTAPYFGALAHEALGDPRRALRLLESSQRRCEAVTRTSGVAQARHGTALLLHRLGVNRRALQLLDEADAEPSRHHCSRTVTADLRGLAHLDSNQPEQALAELRRAEAIALSHCPDPSLVRVIRLDLARAHLELGRVAEARALMSQAKEDARKQPDWSAWELLILAHAQVAEGRDALEAFQQAREAAAAMAMFTVESRALLGWGRQLEEKGAIDEALRIYGEADAVFDRVSLNIPLDKGRATWLGRREAVAAHRIRLLLGQGRRRAAFDVIRRSRAQLLTDTLRAMQVSELSEGSRAEWATAVRNYRRGRSALDAELSELWTLPAADLRARRSDAATRQRSLDRALDHALTRLGPASSLASAPRLPEPGELMLGGHPLPDGRWVSFAADQAGVHAHVHVAPETLDRGALAGQLLEPFARLIRSATRVVVLPYGALRHVDYHALSFDDAPLLATVPVLYSLDLPPLPREAPRRALVVADPEGNLPAARKEGTGTSAALVRWGLTVEVLAGAPGRSGRGASRGAPATFEAVLRGLAQADYFHYAGHGHAGGEDGYASGLALADSEVRVADLLALPDGPVEVVLSACEGAWMGESPVESLGIAHAFLLRGAHTVLATPALAPDRSDFAEALHEASGPLAARARQALLSLHARGLPWTTWRVFTR